MEKWKWRVRRETPPLWKEIGNAAGEVCDPRVIARQLCEKLSTPTWVFLSLPLFSSLCTFHPPSCLDGSYLWIRYSIGFTFHLYPTVYFDHLLRKFLRTSLTLSNESKTILIIRIMSIFPSPFLLPLEIPSNFNESFEKKEKKKPKPILLNQRRRTVSIHATVQHPNNSNKFFSRQTFLPTLSSRFSKVPFFLQPFPLSHLLLLLLEGLTALLSPPFLPFASTQPLNKSTARNVRRARSGQ